MSLNVDWDKMQGLVPAIVQDAVSGAVLMLGYMNREALAATEASGRVTFFSRSQQRLWTKGETSGHHLLVKAMALDCDGDTILVLAEPLGPACHLGSVTCFGEPAPASKAGQFAFLAQLDQLIAERALTQPAGSYTTQLFEAGISRIAQKVGEEGVEAALAAVCKDDQELLGEAADLLYHLTVLLRARDLSLAEAVATLRSRHGR